MTIDVIIPVYNGKTHVKRAVDSVLSCPRARVILVDDGSTDGTGEICDELAAHVRVSVIHRDNGGAAAARNTGLEAAKAEYVTFLDADDVLLQDALDLLLDHLISDLDGVDAIQGRVVRRDAAVSRQPEIHGLTAELALEAAMRDPTRHLHCHGWAFRREALTERFDETLSLGEDGEWLMRTLRTVNCAAYVDTPVYRYTVRRDSTLHSAANVQERYLRTLQAARGTLEALDMPQVGALYVLTHLLLILTHGTFRQRKVFRSWRAAGRLMKQPPFPEAFRQAELTGHSPRIWTLRLLRAGCIPPAWLAIRLRQMFNDGMAARTARRG